MRKGLRVILAAAVSLWVMTAAAQNESQLNDGSKIGEVTFVVSCSLSAQQKFNRAVAILHSFWYEQAESAFSEVIKTDPSCAMGYWGIAMSNWHPLWYPPSAEELSAGSKAAAAAAALGGRTDRERNYIDAISAFYRNSETLDHHTRAVAYEKAMEKVYLRYPEDREAAIFYALALDATASPSDKTYSNQKKAAQILNEIFTEQPDHPGVAHYLIHSYNSAPLAELGLPAAICYSKIAPSVPHALHMPSHIFTRLGKWQESVDANRASLAAAQDYALRHYGAGVAGISRCMPWTISNTLTCSFGKTMPQSSSSTMSTPSARRCQRRSPPLMQWRPSQRAMPWSEGIGRWPLTFHFRRRQFLGPVFPGQRL